MRLEQPPQRSGDNRGGQNDRKGKTEFFHPPLAHSQKQAGRDRRARTGESAKRQAKPLNSTDPAGAPGVDVGTALIPLFPHPGVDDQYPGSQERRADERELREKNFHLRLCASLQVNLLDQQLERQTDDPGDDRGNHDVDRDSLKCRRTGEVVLAPGIPKIDDNGEHGSGVKHHQDERHFGTGRIQAHELLGDNDVCRTRNREKLRGTLDQPKKNDLKKIHAVRFFLDR